MSKVKPTSENESPVVPARPLKEVAASTAAKMRKMSLFDSAGRKAHAEYFGRRRETLKSPANARRQDLKPN